MTKPNPQEPGSAKPKPVFNVKHGRPPFIANFAMLARELPMDTPDEQRLREAAMQMGSTGKRAIEVIEKLEEARAALRELVTLKDMKAKYGANHLSVAEMEDYKARKEPAWEAARRALAQMEQG